MQNTELPDICFTSCDREIKPILKRIKAYPRAFHEIRLDFLSSPKDALQKKLCSGSRVIITCRPEWEGGNFTGNEEERISLLLNAIKLNPGFVDIEFKTPEALKQKVISAARRRGISVIISYHNFNNLRSSFENIQNETKKILKKDHDIIKIAVYLEDAADVDLLFQLRKNLGNGSVIFAGMGEGGVITRVYPEMFQSLFTFIAPAKEQITAPGQITFEELRLYRKNRRLYPAFLGLIGDKAILKSHGIRVYNSLFSTLNLPYVYLPFPTKSFEKFFPIMKFLGLHGASVTSPHKTEALRFCSKLSEEARIAGAVNTVIFDGNELHGYNTDFMAAEQILNKINKKLRGHSRLAAVIGAGGAARAVVAALWKSGWNAVIFNRTYSKARKIAKMFNFCARPLKLLNESLNEFSLLINCTTVGMDADEMLEINPDKLHKKIVIDLVSHPPETKLLKTARESGAEVIPGTYFWILQGIIQMKILIKKNFTIKSLESLINCKI